MVKLGCDYASTQNRYARRKKLGEIAEKVEAEEMEKLLIGGPHA
jgi:hypothetical protein